jgi:hypothetical protein
MAYGTINADQIGTSVANTSLGAGNASTMKNRIINGAMVIDQRNAGASVTETTSNTYVTDRFYIVGSVNSKFTGQQNAGSITPPAGFTNYLGMTSSAATSLGATDYYFLGQAIEGYNIADLGWGTANAKTVTLSFQVYSSLTGTFGGVLRNNAGNRSYPFTYTVSSANTWTSISVTIAGDTSGTWLTTNGLGMSVIWSLGTGSTYSGTAGAWASALYVSATGATSVVGTSGATFYITGVQLEVGSIATGFEYRQYGQELALCQRYYEVKNFAGGLEAICGQAEATTIAAYGIYYTTTKRAAPTALVKSGTFNTTNSSGNGVALSAINFQGSSIDVATFYVTTSSVSLISGNATMFYCGTANGSFAFSAEL